MSHFILALYFLSSSYDITHNTSEERIKDVNLEKKIAKQGHNPWSPRNVRIRGCHVI